MAFIRTTADPLGPLPGAAVDSKQPLFPLPNAPSFAPNPVGSVGSFLLGIYLAMHACAAPEFVANYLGLSIKFVAPLAVLVAILGVVAGKLGRFFSTKISFVFLFLGVLWILSTLLFSYKNEWTNIFQYQVRYHILPILMCSILSTTASLRRAMTLYSLGFVITILFCVLFGYPDAGGRFHIPETSFSNPNDLAFNLLFGVAHVIFFIRRSNVFMRLFAGGTVLAAIYYVLLTGSRANLVVLIVLLLTLFFISSMRMRVALVALSVILSMGALMVLPKQMLTRLSSFNSASQEDLQGDVHLEGALGSTEARKELQRRAITIAIQNPILGVGTGMYIYALNDLMVQQEGRNKGSWQRAHNTYLELAAETGLISLALYVACLLWCVRINFKSLKLLQQTRRSEDAQAMSLSLLMASIAYIVGTAFCSIPYNAAVCVLIGFSAANWITVKQEWLQSSATGNPRQAIQPATPFNRFHSRPATQRNRM